MAFFSTQPKAAMRDVVAPPIIGPLISLRNLEKVFETPPGDRTFSVASRAKFSPANSCRSWARRAPANRRCSPSSACSTACGPANFTSSAIPFTR